MITEIELKNTRTKVEGPSEPNAEVESFHGRDNSGDNSVSA